MTIACNEDGSRVGFEINVSRAGPLMQNVMPELRKTRSRPLMDSHDLNPYKAHDPSIIAGRTPEPLKYQSMLVVLAWLSILSVLIYGFTAMVANGIDLARTRSYRDLVTESWLLGLFAFGCLLCWLTQLTRKWHRADLTVIVILMALPGMAYVIFSAL